MNIKYKVINNNLGGGVMQLVYDCSKISKFSVLPLVGHYIGVNYHIIIGYGSRESEPSKIYLAIDSILHDKEKGKPIVIILLDANKSKREGEL